MPNDVILVTGASSDIGMSLIGKLLSGDTPPTVLAHSNGGGERIKSLRNVFGDLVQPLSADFRRVEEVIAMADEVLARFGAPNAIVHLPALPLVYERFSKFDWGRFESDMSVQLQSAVTILQRLAPKMAKLPRARVIFILSSVTHGMPPKFMSSYTILKYAQLGLMRSLAAEFASTSVRINGISPSMVGTQFLSQVASVAVEMSAAANPQSRNATPQDLLGAIEFLLSPASDFITGVDIPIAAGSVC